MKNVNVSIVVPVYNSSNTLTTLNERIRKTLLKLELDYELILVDDGSKDGSWKRISELKKLFPDTIIGIKLEKNVGQHNAIICGLNFSSGDLVVTMDDDLQHPPEEIEKLIHKFNQTEAEVVYGIYKTRNHNFLKSAGSVIVQKSSKYFADYKGGVGSSFRLFQKSLVDQIKNHSQNFIYIDEIIHWYTGNIEIQPIEHHARKEGKSSYTIFKLIGLYLSVLVNFTAWPLKLITFAGVLASIVSFSIGSFYIFKKMYFNVEVEGFTALIVAVSFSTSLIMMTLGIIGQYIYKIYQQQNGKPPYAVNTVL